MDLLQAIAQVATALLAILGGLKVLARYTKTQADDLVLEKIEAPLKFLRDLLNKGK